MMADRSSRRHSKGDGWKLATSVFAILILGAPSLSAESGSGSLTMAEAVRRSLETHPMAGLAQAHLDSAEASLSESRAAREPRLSISGSAVRYEEPMVVTPIHGFEPGLFPEFDRTLVQGGLNVDYLLWDGGLTPAKIRESEAGVAVASSGFDAARDLVILRTAETYLSVLSFAEVLSAHEARTRSLESELSRVRQLRDVGRAAEVEVLRVEAALAAAEASRAEVAGRLDSAEHQLARIIGASAETVESSELRPVTLGDPALEDRNALVRKAMESNPEAERARRAMAVREAGVAAARATALPSFRAVGNWLQFGDDSLSFTSEWNVGVSMRIPVFDGGATRARIEKAKAGVRAAEEDLRLVEYRLGEEVDEALAALTETTANIESLSRAVDGFAEVVRIEKLRLQNGVGTQPDYLRAEADLLNARASLAAARDRKIMLHIRIARLAGDLDVSWLERHLENV